MVDKTKDVMTVSDRFREGLVEFFASIGATMRCVEMGCYKGYTTRLLGELFSSVVAVDISPEMQAYNVHTYPCTRVMWATWDSRDVPWWFGPAHVYFIDAIHTYQCALSDALQAVADPTCQYVVFDDYGAHQGVHDAVSELVEGGRLGVVREVGYEKGMLPVTPTNTLGAEGVICKVIR